MIDILFGFTVASCIFLILIKLDFLVWFNSDLRKLSKTVRDNEKWSNPTYHIYRALDLIKEMMQNPNKIGDFERLILGNYKVSEWRDKIDGKEARRKKFEEEVEKLKEKYNVN